MIQKKSQRKASGARYKSKVTKKIVYTGNKATLTGIGSKRVVTVRVKGGEQKNKSLSHESINVFDPKKKKHISAKIKTVSLNKANRHFERRNIITKGAIVETDIGRVKITNRPGQEGTLNGIIISE